MTAPARRKVDHVTVTPEQRTKLLELVARQPGVGIANALHEVGVQGSKGQLREYVTADPDLADDIQEARGSTLRGELIHRAVEGDEETVYNVKGDPVGTRTVKSDRLLEFACRMYLPEARALRSGHVEVTGRDGGPVELIAHERRLTLADVLAFADRIEHPQPVDGSLGAARAELPAARQVLAEPDQDQRAASPLPAGSDEGERVWRRGPRGQE